MPLAVCIGDVHGRDQYPLRLDFARLAAIAGQAQMPLVLKGTSVLPEAVFDEAINHGFRKCNVNTEVKSAYLQGLSYYLRQAGDKE